MNLLKMHEVIKAENEVLKAQMKYQKATSYENDRFAEKYVLEIVELNKEANKRKAKLEKRK